MRIQPTIMITGHNQATIGTSPHSIEIVYKVKQLEKACSITVTKFRWTGTKEFTNYNMELEPGLNEDACLEKIAAELNALFRLTHHCNHS